MDSTFSLGYNNLIFPFLILLFGFILALLISISERVTKRLRFEGNNVEMDQETQSKTLEIGHVDNGNENLMHAARKRILELETEREKLQAENMELKHQLECSHHLNNDNV